METDVGNEDIVQPLATPFWEPERIEELERLMPYTLRKVSPIWGKQVSVTITVTRKFQGSAWLPWAWRYKKGLSIDIAYPSEMEDCDKLSGYVDFMIADYTKRFLNPFMVYVRYVKKPKAVQQ